jgi:hypothetical protein
MTRTAIVIAVGLALAATLSAAPAQAQRVFVSATGSDGNPCTFASPCRSFQHAHDVAPANGEISVLDSAGYGPLAITKAISIVNPGGVEAGITPAAGGDAITINTSGDVQLRGLTLEGDETGKDGVSLTNAGTLAIIDCVIRHFTHDGIYLQPTGSLEFSIRNTVASNNGNDGIDLSPSGNSAGLFGVIDHSTAFSNATDGISVWGANSAPSTLSLSLLLEITIINSVASSNGANGVKVHSTVGTIPVFVMVRDTTASLNGNDGVLFDANSNGLADMALGHSVAVGNVNYGVENNSASRFETYNDNNVTLNINGDTSGTLSVTSFH